MRRAVTPSVEPVESRCLLSAPPAISGGSGVVVDTPLELTVITGNAVVGYTVSDAASVISSANAYGSLSA